MKQSNIMNICDVVTDAIEFLSMCESVTPVYKIRPYTEERCVIVFSKLFKTDSDELDIICFDEELDATVLSDDDFMNHIFYLANIDYNAVKDDVKAEFDRVMSILG